MISRTMVYGSVFIAYGWSLLLTVRLFWYFVLTVEIRFGLFCSRLKFGFVFVTYGSPRPEIGLGL